ncbi:SH3 domain-containing protein [Xylariomycetidae sp. FL0641]|nr:SH3 domain-containing protein [Xylariomycetidae sp. FL0641]
MQSMQRSFGRMLHKSPGDNAKAAALLGDYEDADRILTRIIEQAKSWRDSWVLLASSQLGIVSEYDGLYDPIVGASDGHGKPSLPTPERQLEQTLRLKEAYAEFKTELVDEVALIEARVIKPATDARDCIAPFRKAIKKRENKRLDYEKAQDKAHKLQKKPGRSAKEDASLVKADAEMARTAEEFHAEDAHLREVLPPLIEATFSLIPPLVSAVVAVQNRLLGLYYTTLHNYCENQGFPSPAPPMDQVVATWRADYEPAKREFESVSCVAGGKAVRMPMTLPDDPSNSPNQDRRPSNASAASSAGPENGSRRISSNGPPAPGSRPVRIPSTTSLGSQQPSPSLQKRPSFANNLHPTDFTTASRLGMGQSPTTGTPHSVSPGASSVRSRSDYFDAQPTLSRTTTASSAASTPNATFINSSYGQNGGMSAVAAAASKKKAPPPPPKPRSRAPPPSDDYVIALYDFTAQGAGDLGFREGDRIRVIKRTGTDQDWWVGELGGVKGSFPANYCRAA